MARGWHYAKLSLSNALLLSFSGMCILLLFLSFCRFCFVFVVFSLLSLELCRCFLCSFSVQHTMYRIVNHVYYWVWLFKEKILIHTFSVLSLQLKKLR